MYGKIHQRKLKETDYLLSCQQARKQLDEYMDNQNKRVNIDSAKKLAVLQHMDYQGFRQMVLGAHIFPTKSKELYYFSKGQQINPTNPNKLYDQNKGGKQMAQLQRRIQGNSQKHCFNFRDFKKKFLKFYDKQLSWQKAQECYSLTKQQDKSRLYKIFGLDCQADILVKIVQCFTFIIQFLKKEENLDGLKVQISFMVKFIHTALLIPTMQSISINILTKKQKERIAKFLEESKEILQNQTILEIIPLLKK